jgi:hypothetical protein
MRPARLPAALLAAALVLIAGWRLEADVSPVPALPIHVEEPAGIGPAIVPKVSALPPRARVQWPAFDGDAFWVALPDGPGGGLTPTDVRAQYVSWILEALGAAPGEVTLLDPPAGVPQPVASPRALVHLAATHVDSVPALARTHTKRMLAALEGANDPEADRLFEAIEGRSRAAALADLARREIRYSFYQTVNGVPVEFAIVAASRWDGRTVNGLRGSVLTKWKVVNSASLSAADAVKAALQTVGKRPGLAEVARDERAPEPALVMLPYGRDDAGRAQLRHAYRVHLAGRFRGIHLVLLAWIDTADGSLLKLKPLLSAAAATGLVWRRDPREAAQPASFAVDPAQGGVYTLQRATELFQLHLGSGTSSPLDVSLPAGGSATANFDQAPINDATGALCGTNKAFQQVHTFATLSRFRDQILAQGMSTPYPPFGGLAVFVEAPDAGCNSWSSANTVMFGFCAGTPPSGCPGPQLNFAHDVTMLAHELGHTVTKRLMEYRRVDECPMCPVGPGLGALEDLADFWASHLTWTNCIAGWIGQNTGGSGQGLDCARHDQGAGFPRKLDLPADRFPDKRIDATVGSASNPCVPTASIYCNGQIGAAALWDARLGLRSRSPLLGVPEFGTHTQAALRNLIVTPDLDQSSATDLKIYRLLQGILLELTNEYASTSGASLTNKVLAGFARVGLFLAPYQCLATSGSIQAGSPTGPAASPCAPGSAADAVIDVDDRDASNDPVIFGVKYRQSDYIRTTGRIPRFDVWTGARYRFDLTTGKVDLSGTAPCHKAFIVELSTKPNFPIGATFSSGWRAVASTTSSNPNACQGSWTPTSANIPRDVVGTAVYYRVRTRPGAGGAELVSTEPGGGIVGEIPPPFVLVTADGRPPY